MNRLFLSLILSCIWALLWGDPYSELVTLYERYGNETYMIDEEITQKAHVLQAAYLASYVGAPEYAIVSLLYHDIGQFIDDGRLEEIYYLHATHDDVGGYWLEQRNFPQDVVDFVRFHTLAKVVLCMENKSYYTYLSSASQNSFHIQYAKYMGEHNQVSFREFECHPLREDYLKLRKCDDMAKILNFNCTESFLPDFNHYREAVKRVMVGAGKQATNSRWRQDIDELHQQMCEDRQLFEDHIKAVDS